MTFGGASGTRCWRSCGRRRVEGCEWKAEQSAVIDSAARAGVVVNTIDACGVYTDGSVNAERQGTPSTGELSYNRGAAVAGVLAELAAGTGGMFVRNTNDLAGGVRRLASPPERYYVLRFVPETLDGKFHELRVRVDPPRHTVSTRRGYFASENAFAGAFETSTRFCLRTIHCASYQPSYSRNRRVI